MKGWTIKAGSGAETIGLGHPTLPGEDGGLPPGGSLRVKGTITHRYKLLSFWKLSENEQNLVFKNTFMH